MWNIGTKNNKSDVVVPISVQILFYSTFKSTSAVPTTPYHTMNVSDTARQFFIIIVMFTS